jgi:hypothetical protein
VKRGKKTRWRVVKRKKKHARKDSTDTKRYQISVSKKREREKERDTQRERERERERDDTREPQIPAGVDCRGVFFICMCIKRILF